MADKVEKKPTAELELSNGEALEFFVETEHYIKFTNDVLPQKKYPAQFNFLTSTIREDQKEKLAAILQKNPQLTTEYFGLVFESYEPDQEYTVKKRNGEQID